MMPIGWVNIARWYCHIEKRSCLKYAALCGLKRTLSQAKEIKELVKLQQSIRDLYCTQFGNGADVAVEEIYRTLMKHKQFEDELGLQRIRLLA